MLKQNINQFIRQVIVRTILILKKDRIDASFASLPEYFKLTFTTLRIELLPPQVNLLHEPAPRAQPGAESGRGHRFLSRLRSLHSLEKVVVGDDVQQMEKQRGRRPQSSRNMLNQAAIVVDSEFVICDVSRLT